jgi:hypothetical protein
MPFIKTIGISFLFFTVNGFGQANQDKRILDSLRRHDYLLKMIESIYSPTSYFTVEIGAGNKLFGVRNNSLNALQSDNKLILTPSATYYHKSGFGINATAYLLFDKNKKGLYQYSFSPSYDYLTGKTFGATASYTWYFIPNKYDPSASPIQHDLYAAFRLKRGWVRPGLSVNYSMGNYYEVIKIDTTLSKQNQTVRIQFVDTIKAKLNSFGLTGKVEHTFKYYGIFNDKDAFNFTTQLLLNLDYNAYKVDHNSTTNYYNTFTKNKRKRTFNTTQSETSLQSDNGTFDAQSAGFNLIANYLSGNFNISPGIYLDYYLPSTKTKRLTQFINFVIGYRF